MCPAYLEPYGNLNGPATIHPRRIACIEVLRQLGSRASAAVPRLEKILRQQTQDRLFPWDWRDPFKVDTNIMVAAALLQITGDEERFVPILRRGFLASPGNRAVLGDLAKDRPWAMAELLKSLDSPDPIINSAAAIGLERCGRAAKDAVPGLLRLIARTRSDRSDPFDRPPAYYAVEALKTIDPSVLETNPFVLDYLELTCPRPFPRF